MKPLKLTMQAFGPYAGTCVVDFARIDHGLFLLTGPTGAGKTTIFDAVKYALFGVMSGSGRKAKSARSDFAADDLLSYVELEFSHGGKTYRAYRAPEQMRRSKRKVAGEYKLTSVPEEVAFECLTDGLSLAGKGRQMNQLMEEMLGISADQFGRIVMIAQGEFAAVLNAGTEKRREIFRRVFGTDVYLQVQQLLKERDKNLTAQLALSFQQMNDTLGRMQVSKNSQHYDRWQELHARKDRGHRSAEYQELLLLVDAEDSAHKAKGEGELAETRKQLEALDQRIGAEELLDTARKTLESNKKWIQDNQQRVADLAQAAEALRAQEPEREALAASIATLKASLPDYAKLAEAQQNATTAKNKLSQAEMEAANATAKVKQLQEGANALANEQKSLANIDAIIERLRSQQKELSTQLGNITTAQDAVKAESASAAAYKRAKQHAVKANDAFAQAAQKHVQARLEYNSQIAGVLAAGLQDAQPCPVCGSPVHPQPAALSEGALTAEEVDALEAAANAAQQAATTAASKAAAAEEKHTAAQETLIAAVQKALGDTPSTLDISEALSAAKTQFEAESTAVQNQLESAAKQAERRDELAGLITTNAINLQKAQSDVETAKTSVSAARTTLAAHEATAASIASNLEYPTQVAAKAALKAMEADAASKRAALEKAMQDEQTAQRELQNARIRVEESEKTLNGQTSGTEDLQALKDQRNHLQTRAQSHESGIANLQKRLYDYARMQEDIQEILQQRGNLEQEQRLIHDMSAIANGDAAGKAGRVAFETYVQGVYFDQVLAAANERLQVMSGTRYTLLRRTAAGDARSVTGLDMDVLDRNTGVRRAVDTLSGGETFLASLSLALGFSDVIQAQAGGIELDAMFIDEGFGSLDDDTCREAIDVLDHLAADDRLIGIISHVDLLKEHIPRQVVIQKTTTGSTVKMEV
ncbi:MAG: SMC family ATPase [Coriobacteriia bacterium]|nr:SMC family ATPase [Coriobacteriia bacterium]